MMSTGRAQFWCFYYFSQAGVVSWRAGQTSCGDQQRLQDGQESSRQAAGQLGQESSKPDGQFASGGSPGVRVHNSVAAHSCWIRGVLDCGSTRYDTFWEKLLTISFSAGLAITVSYVPALSARRTSRRTQVWAGTESELGEPRLEVWLRVGRGVERGQTVALSTGWKVFWCYILCTFATMLFCVYHNHTNDISEKFPLRLSLQNNSLVACNSPKVKCLEWPYENTNEA